ncbi:MAG: hypothetical protein K9G11_00230 [Rickettsiaceae bacterium]|nr:hypothetical protein [Rickettsiaceae bacterium]
MNYKDLVNEKSFAAALLGFNFGALLLSFTTGVLYKTDYIPPIKSILLVNIVSGLWILNNFCCQEENSCAKTTEVETEAAESSLMGAVDQ